MDYNIISNIFLLLVLFGIFFSIIPKFIFRWVKNLLSYVNYTDEPIKNNFTQTIGIYVTLGITLGFIFSFLLKNITGIDTATNNQLELLLLSFSVSFSLVIILRISVLLNKSNIIAKILPKRYENKLQTRSQNYPYHQLKNEFQSFLFSIFLTAILSLVVYFFYNLLFKSENILAFSLAMKFISLRNYTVFVILFILALGIITFLGEVLLYYIGVHPKCSEEENA